MSCINLTPPIVKRLNTTSTSYRFEPFTDWSSAVGVDYLRAVAKTTSKVGAEDFLVRLAIQTAAVRPSNPGAWTAFGDSPFLTNEQDKSSSRIDLTSYTATKQFYRLGLAYKAGAAGDVSGDVSLQACTEAYGKITGVLKDQALVAPDTGSYYIPIGGWMPTLMVSKIKAAIIVTQATGNFKVGLAYQLAPHSVEAPSAWQAVGDLNDDDEVNTEEQSITVSNDEMWVRMGLLYTNDSSGTNGQGVVTVFAGVRK